MIKLEYKHSGITSNIIGAALMLHKNIGSGFQESIYHHGLFKEMNIAGISFISEYKIPIVYKGELLGNRRLDFLVEEFVLVEIKAVNTLENVHFVQALNYLEAGNFEVGLLINFGAKSLQIKRQINSRCNKLDHYSKLSEEDRIKFSNISI